MDFTDDGSNAEMDAGMGWATPSGQERAESAVVDGDAQPSQMVRQAGGQERWHVDPSHYTFNVKGGANPHGLNDVKGAGAFGTVCTATRVSANRGHMETKVVFKKIPCVICPIGLKGGHNGPDVITTKRILRELSTLRQFSHPNMVRVLDAFAVGFGSGQLDMYLGFEFMDTDLAKIMRTSQAIGIDHVQHIFLQLLDGLAYIHSAGILHRDLKPANILVNADVSIKICDFGAARFSPDLLCEPAGPLGMSRDKSEGNTLTTLWYRAPECLMGALDYTEAVDVWAAGAILGELLIMQGGGQRKDSTTSSRHMFPGGGKYSHEDSTVWLDQINTVVGRIGSPPPDMSSLKHFGGGPNVVMTKPAWNPAVTFPRAAAAAPAFASLLKGLLAWKPEDRTAVLDARNHDFFGPNPRPAPALFLGSFDASRESVGVHQEDLPVLRAALQEEAAMIAAQTF